MILREIIITRDFVAQLSTLLDACLPEEYLSFTIEFTCDRCGETIHPGVEHVCAVSTP